MYIYSYISSTFSSHSGYCFCNFQICNSLVIVCQQYIPCVYLQEKKSPKKQRTNKNKHHPTSSRKLTKILCSRKKKVKRG